MFRTYANAESIEWLNACIYAALAFNQDTARLAREHDKANVLVLPADYISDQEACDMVRAWLASDFLGGKYQRRIAMIDEIR